MDPITRIVMALALGVAAGLKPMAEQAVWDGYTRLKALITRKYAQVPLEPLEASPTLERRREVEAALVAAGADTDAEVLRHADALLETIQRQAPEAAAAIGVSLHGITAHDVTISDVHVTYIQGIPEERHERLAGELGVTRSALTSFFKILEQRQVPPEDLDHTLRQIATSYKELHARLQRFTSDDPAVLTLKQQARDAVEAGEFTRAEALLNEASTKDLEAAQHLQEVATTRLLSAAASRAANGDLQRTQLAYAEAMGYYQQAVDVMEAVPTAQLELAEYLNAWGLTAYEAGEYSAAEPLLQRALGIREQGLGPAHPDVAYSLNNLAGLYYAQGRYSEAEPLYQQARAILEQSVRPDHPDVATVQENYVRLLQDRQHGDRRQDPPSEPPLR